MQKGTIALNETSASLAETGDSFDIPSFEDMSIEEGDLEVLFKLQLDELVKSRQSHAYLNGMAHVPGVRENVGLPVESLWPGERLLMAKKHIPGLQSSYFYLSKTQSLFELHREDLGLKSANILYKGAPKLWISFFQAPKLPLKLD